MKKNNYWISPDQNGWKAQREKSEKASGRFDTQKEAESYARQLLKNNTGGELITQNEQGQIRSKDTINKHDPRSSTDTEH